MPKLLCCLLLASTGMGCAAARGEPAAAFPQSFAVGNQSPVMGIFGIPRADGTAVLGAGTMHWDALLDHASHFQGGDAGGETLFFDGETTRVALRARYGISDEWEIGMEIPWVHHGPGFLDHFIIEWHDAWGFPQGGRDQVDNNVLSYRYERDGVRRLDIDAATGGIGDTIVSTRRALWRGPGSAGVAHAQLKLPTGKADRLTGSGAADVAAGIELSRRWQPGWHSTLRGGAAYLGRGDVLPDLQRRGAVYGGADLVWRPLRALALRVQYDAHTAPYTGSALDELTDWSGLLTAGGTWHLTHGLALDLAVVENVPNADVAPDVSFQVRLRTTPSGRH